MRGGTAEQPAFGNASSLNAEDSGQHGCHTQVIHHQLRAQKHQQNSEVVTVMSTLDRSFKPRFQVVRMIKCDGLCYFRGNGVFMLDLMLQYWYRRDRRWPKVTKMAGKMKILL